MGFLQLMQELGEVANEGNLQALEIKSLRNMLLFQYLINALEGDFLPRNRVYEETMNWTHLRESLLNLLLYKKNKLQRLDERLLDNYVWVI
uniref:Uncharacterized protein n=1 Tax=Salix viminalis TaxID=40686 RepID=A0A6N2KP90_SALVM